MVDAEGNLSGAVETLQDTTERRRAEEARLKSERRFRTLLDIAPYSILVFSVEGLVSYLNPAFTETFGWTLDELNMYPLIWRRKTAKYSECFSRKK